MKKKTVLIFSGYNARALLAFLRTLENNKIDYSIVSNGDDDFIYGTRYKENVILKRSMKALSHDLFLQIADKLNGEFDFFIIAPSTEYLNQEILNQREELEKLSFVVPLVERHLYNEISDKYSFTRLCKKHHLKVPTCSFNIEDISLPLVAKPINYKSEVTQKVHSPEIIRNKREIDNFCKEKDVGDFFYQDYISGQSFYLLFYFDSNGRVYKYSQQNLIQQPGGKSILLACPSDVHHSSVSVRYEQMFLKEGFKGFVMVELKKENNEFFMIEANPRFWGPSQYFIDSGINLFENFLFDYGLIEHEPIHKLQPAYYFWDDGSLFCEKTSILNAFHDYSFNAFKMHSADIKKYEIFKGDIRFE